MSKLNTNVVSFLKLSFCPSLHLFQLPVCRASWDCQTSRQLNSQKRKDGRGRSEKANKREIVGDKDDFFTLPYCEILPAFLSTGPKRRKKTQR